MSDENEVILGIVRTNRVGSDSNFEICTRKEWDAMTTEQRQKELIDAMWASGIIDVFPDNADL